MYVFRQNKSGNPDVLERSYKKKEGSPGFRKKEMMQGQVGLLRIKHSGL